MKNTVQTAAAYQAMNCVDRIFAGDPTLDEVSRRLEAARTKPEEVKLSDLPAELAELVKTVVFHPGCPQDLLDGIYMGCWNVGWTRLMEKQRRGGRREVRNAK